MLVTYGGGALRLMRSDRTSKHGHFVAAASQIWGMGPYA